MPLTLLAPLALQDVLPGLLEHHFHAGGASVVTHLMLNPEISDVIMAEQPFDVAITNPGYVVELLRLGLGDADSHRALARVPLALGQRDETPVPAETSEAVAALLRGAETIAYTGAGTSGRIFLDMAARLDVLEAIAARLRPMDGGGPIRAVAECRCALAAAPLTTVLGYPGVSVAAILPSALGTDIDMSIFVSPRSPARSDANALVDFLTNTALDATLAQHGVRRFTLTT